MRVYTVPALALIVLPLATTQCQYEARAEQKRIADKVISSELGKPCPAGRLRDCEARR